MAKRANGEGTLSPRRDKNGKIIGWRAAVTVGYKENGKQDRRWISGKTQAEVQQKLRAFQSDMHTGMVADTDGLTVAEFMLRWTDHKQRDGVKSNTVQSYRDTVRLYITPHLGGLKLEKLRPLDVEQLLLKLHKAGKSAAVSAYTLSVLKMGLRQALRWQMLPRNVAEAVRPPKVERPDMQIWTPGEVVTFLDSTQAHRLHAAFYLALLTGMRRGEILGLKWEDMDFEHSRLNVRNNLVDVQGEAIAGKMHMGKPTITSRTPTLGTPKTKASRRTIVLSAGTLSKLREHQGRQKAERMAAAEAWQGQGYVFASELGGPTNPDALSKLHQKLSKLAGVPRIRFHDLRDTAASLMIRQGVPPKTVCDRLGHTDVAFTLKTYVHLYDEQRIEAAFELSDLFPVSVGGLN